MDMTWVSTYEHLGNFEHRWFYMRASVIAYRRPVWRAPGELGRCNLVFESTLYMSDGANEDLDHIAPQPPEFLAWARRVLRWMRRNTQRHGYYRATAGALAEEAKGVQLVF